MIVDLGTMTRHTFSKLSPLTFTKLKLLQFPSGFMLILLFLLICAADVYPASPCPIQQHKPTNPPPIKVRRRRGGDGCGAVVVVTDGKQATCDKSSSCPFRREGCKCIPVSWSDRAMDGLIVKIFCHFDGKGCPPCPPTLLCSLFR